MVNREFRRSVGGTALKSTLPENSLWTECRPTLNTVFKREFLLGYQWNVFQLLLVPVQFCVHSYLRIPWISLISFGYIEVDFIVGGWISWISWISLFRQTPFYPPFRKRYISTFLDSAFYYQHSAFYQWSNTEAQGSQPLAMIWCPSLIYGHLITDHRLQYIKLLCCQQLVV